MYKINNTKGITLISLVVTIIILLILAGVTIATLSGENGILKRAGEAKKSTNVADIKEQILVQIIEEQSLKDGNITEDSLKEILSKYGTINYEQDGTTIKGITTKENYEILLSEIWTGTTQKVDNKQKTYIIKEGKQQIEGVGVRSTLTEEEGYLNVKTNVTTARAGYMVNIDTTNYKKAILDIEVVSKDLVSEEAFSLFPLGEYDATHKKRVGLADGDVVKKERNIYEMDITEFIGEDSIFIYKNATRSNTTSIYNIYNLWLEE